MYVIACSDYLRQQEAAARGTAQALLADAARSAPTAGLLRRIVWAFVGKPPAVRHAEQQRQAALYAARSYAYDATQWAKGSEGEQALAAVLARRLDHRYLLLRNYTPPHPWQSGGDIDALLLGPHGITVFEVKAWRGDYLYDRTTWYFRRGPYTQWESTRANPCRQVLDNAARVRHVLQRAGVGALRIIPIIVAASTDMRLELVPPLQAYVYFPHRAHASLEPLLGTPQQQTVTPEVQRSLLDTLLPAAHSS